MISSNSNSKLLYIGLNGYAGSGKDTVARMLKTILKREWASLDECKQYYAAYYEGKVVPATHPEKFLDANDESLDSPVYCIAFADQLKNICATIFGIPVERFYENKETAWICINKGFEYTEVKPSNECILTAEDFYNDMTYYKVQDQRYWMSLREVLVYIGTYVLQSDVNQNIFVNIVKNKIQEMQNINCGLKYVIITDVRFGHELSYINENNGITVTICRDTVKQLNNIAEHDLDDENDYDFTIENNGTYDDLFEEVWDMVHDNVEFKNMTIDLHTREAGVNNYMRLVDDADNVQIYKLCSPYHINKLSRSEGAITEIDPVGGPMIRIGDKIEGTPFIVQNIEYARAQFLLYVI